MNLAEGGGIFVSYRRQETSHLAGRLYDRLADRFGEGQVFIDVDAIEPGVDFAEEIFSAVAACRVLLAIIGPTWLAAVDDRGQRRLDDPDDIVRLEVEAALARGVRVIPILVEGAVMPARRDLPDSLAGLARRNALAIRHESFRYDAGRLVTAPALRSPAAAVRAGIMAVFQEVLVVDSRSVLENAWLGADTVFRVTRPEAERRERARAVFANRDGGWMSLTNMRRGLRAALPPDLSWLTPHSFRRTVASVVRDALGAELAQQELSHAKLATTEAHHLQRQTRGPDVRDVLDKYAGGDCGD